MVQSDYGKSSHSSRLMRSVYLIVLRTKKFLNRYITSGIIFGPKDDGIHGINVVQNDFKIKSLSKY